MYDDIWGLDRHYEPQKEIEQPEPSQVDWAAIAKQKIPRARDKGEHTNTGLNRTL